jgi:sugar lactone lactonase YvrE
MNLQCSASTLLFAALTLSTTLSPLHAQFVQQGPPLVGTGAVAPSLQGEAVALSADGNTAIVGGLGDSDSTGAIWIFTRSNGVWSQQGPKLVGSGAVGNAAQGFGVAISADGNTAIEVGPNDGTVGAAWVFTRSNGVWSQQGPKLVTSGAVGDPQEISVGLSADGNTAVVGGLSDNNQTGAVWVFTRSNGVWSQQGPKLVGSGYVGEALQGRSVAISGDGNTLAETGPSDNNDAGAIWIFTRTNGVWSQQGNKLVGSYASSEGFGAALSGDGNTVITGGEGGAWIFVRSNGVWSQQAQRLNGSGATSSEITAVGLSGDGNTAILGDSEDTGVNGNPGFGSEGASWIFVRLGSGWYQLGGKMSGTGADAYQEQGTSVGLSADGSTAIVGGDDYFTSNPGASWIYTRLPILYILDSGNHLIWMYDTHGDPLFFENAYAATSQPSGLSVDSSGYFWLTDSSLNQVVKEDGGDVVLRFGTTGRGPGQLYQPNGIAIDSSGNVWIADTGNNRIQEFDGNGNFLFQFGGLGGGNGQFNAPVGIAIGASGNIWVADTGNNRIQEFDGSGHFLLKFGSFGNAGGLFEGPFSIAFDPAGNAWIADPYNQRIEEFSSGGVFLQAFGGGFSFPSPYGIAVDFLGNIWGVDYNSSHIVELSSSGVELFQFGTIGAYSAGQFYHPTYIVAK